LSSLDPSTRRGKPAAEEWLQREESASAAYESSVSKNVQESPGNAAVGRCSLTTGVALRYPLMCRGCAIKARYSSKGL
jgi:hypothetical protein